MFNTKEEIIKKWVLVYSIVDLIFLPRLISIFSTPSSLLLLILSINIIRKEIKNRDLLFIFTLLLIGTTSIEFGLLTNSISNYSDNFKRLLQIILILNYYFLARNVVLSEKTIIYITYVFLSYNLILTALFYTHPLVLQEYMTNWYPETLDNLENTVEVLRYSYIFSDPNSAGYFLCMILAFYLLNTQNTFSKIIVNILFIPIILCTQSRGAYLCLFTIQIAYLYKSNALNRTKNIIIFLAIILITSILILHNLDILKNASQVFLSRFNEESDIGGGRFGKYIYFLSNINILPFGTGYHLYQGFTIFRPHSDLIRLILSYGFIFSFIYSMYIIPKNRRKFYLIIPFMFPFLINSIIDDFRLLGIYFIFIQLNVISSRKEAM